MEYCIQDWMTLTVRHNDQSTSIWEARLRFSPPPGLVYHPPHRDSSSIWSIAMKLPKAKNRTYGDNTNVTVIAMDGAHMLLLLLLLLLMAVMTMTMTMTCTTGETDDLKCRPSNSFEHLESGQLSFNYATYRMSNMYIMMIMHFITDFLLRDLGAECDIWPRKEI